MSIEPALALITVPLLFSNKLPRTVVVPFETITPLLFSNVELIIAKVVFSAVTIASVALTISTLINVTFALSSIVKAFPPFALITT